MTTAQLQSVSDGRRIELDGQLVAGRSADCDLVLTEGHPSRRHAQITVDDEGVWLEDLGSTNGTFVNGEKVEAKVRLQPGDRVRFDLEEFELVDTAAEAADVDPNATVLRSPPPSLGGEGTAGSGTPAAAEPPPEPEAAAPEAAAPAAEQPEARPEARKPEPEQPEPQPEARSPEPEPEPADRPAAREVEAKGAERRPGAWADPDRMNEGGTVMLNPEQLQELLSDSKPSPEPLADADAPYLTVTAGKHGGEAIKLVAGQESNVWSVGSDAERDIVFDEDGVSGFHAKIVNEGNRWKVIDQMSANGTLVNEKRGSISFLSSGDRIRFGPVECVFHLPAALQARSTGPAQRSAAASGSGTGARSGWIVAAVVLAAFAAAVAGYWFS